MFLKSYALPPWEFVRGEAKEQRITLRHTDGSLYELGTVTVSMDIGDFVNRNMAPVYTGEQEIVEDENGTSCILKLVLDANVTEKLSGTGEYVLKESTVSGDNGNYSLSATWDGGSSYEEFRIQAGTDDANGALSVTIDRYEGVCLSGDTLITLVDRTERRLDELTGTEMVLGGDMRPARILRLARGLWSDRHTLYHFDDGTVIDETHEHRFYNVDQGFWQKLKNWHIGDHAKHLDGSTPALVSVEPKEEQAEMFGLWVERGSYWANSLLSGDASANRPLLANATVEQAIDMAESLTEKDLMRILGGGVPL